MEWKLACHPGSHQTKTEKKEKRYRWYLEKMKAKGEGGKIWKREKSKVEWGKRS